MGVIKTTTGEVAAELARIPREALSLALPGMFDQGYWQGLGARNGTAGTAMTVKGIDRRSCEAPPIA